MAVITTKFAGRCNCGAPVAKGTRVRWDKLNGIHVCPACTVKTLAKASVKVGSTSYFVAVKGREGRVTGASVSVNTAELSGAGAIHFNADGTVRGIGGTPSVRADLCDYIAGAKAAARQLCIDKGLRK